MDKVEIKRNTNGDTRVAEKTPTFYEFADANTSHIEDVKSMMRAIAYMINDAGKNHDWTKTKEPYRSNFYRDLCNTIEGRIKFEDGQWNKDHYALERHHLLKRCPDDVNLIDVIEMICDCVCAGMARSGEVREARSGEVRDLEISEDILLKAVKNTVEMCKEAVVLKGEQEND